jgi:Secretion system C-terminal sorting domain
VKKNLLTLACLLMLHCAAFAQLTAGSIAPDFTATDINGRTYNLYSILDSGKSVIIDISATWCAPCWAFHNSRTLETIHNTYGAAGTNQVRVFFVEGDSRTNSADLNGTGTNTQGNWVAGTPYPILDNSAIASSYRIAYFPTLYVICPDRRLVEVTNKSVANIMAATNACPPPSNGRGNAFVRDYTGFKDYFCQSKTFTPQVLLQNNGVDTIRTMNVALTNNGTAVETQTFTGTILPNAQATLAFSSLTATATANLAFNIVNVNGAVDAVPYRNSITQTIERGAVLARDTFTLEVKTDADPAEQRWLVVKDRAFPAVGDTIAQGGNPNVRPGSRQSSLVNAGNMTAASTVYTTRIVLQRGGCYQFIALDDYGDGLGNTYNGASLGYYKLWRGATTGGQLLYASFGTDAFSQLARPVELTSSVGTNDLSEQLTKIQLAPNPANDVLNVLLTSSKNNTIGVSIVNALGQTVQNTNHSSLTIGQNQLQIPTADLANGMYFLVLRNDQGAAQTLKFTVQH